MRLTISRKLGAGFAAVLVLMAVVAGVAAYSVVSLRGSANKAVHEGARLNAIALEVQVRNGEARRREKDFLLNVPLIGVRQAEDIYVPKVVEEADAMTRLADEGARLATSDADRDRFAQIAQLAASYRDGFAQTVSLLEQRGDEASGATGDLMTTTEEIEALLDGQPDASPAAVAFTKLQLAEQQYLNSLENKDVTSTNDAFESLTTATSTLPASLREPLGPVLERHAAAFTSMVALDKQITSASATYRDTGIIISGAADEIAASGVAASSAATSDIDATSATSIILVSAFSVAALILATGLSYLLSRSIVARLRGLTDLAERVSLGEVNLAVERRAADEIGDLEESFARVVTAVRFYQFELESLEKQNEAAA